MRSEGSAARLMAAEMFSGMLASVDPRDLGQRLTAELRELTGARTVLLLAHRSESGTYELLHASPARRASLFTAADVQLFSPETTPDPLPRTPGEMPEDLPLRAVLQRTAIKSMLRFSLRAMGDPIGAVVLLDLPGLDRIGEAVDFITLLSAPMALALRNSLAVEQIEKQRRQIAAYARELEQRVDERTAELSATNVDLAAARLAALNVMEDAVEARNRTEQVNAALRKEVEQRRQAEESLRRSVDFTEALNRISRSFLIARSDDDVYDDVLRIVLDALESPLGVFGYINRQGDLVCPSMTREVWSQCRMSNRTNVFPKDTWADAIWGRGLRTGEPQYRNAPSLVPAGHLPIERCLTVPLRYQDRSIGVFTVANKPRDYTDADLDLLRRIAEHVAPVLNAMLDRHASEEEREKLQRQLLQSQKLESIGQLAGGIAHDFNNVLAAIFGYGALLQMKMRADDPLREFADQLLASAERAAGLTQSLLAFSRKQRAEPAHLDLNGHLGKVTKFLSRIIGENVAITVSLCERPLIIFADPTQMEQVVLNLATNARDAMPKGGTLMIQTERVQFDPTQAASHGFPGGGGSYAALLVSDTGIGMDEETQARIFEPFFTTKEVGKGTGLGLAIVYGAVEQNGGHIDVYSEPGVGTTFKVYFPLVDAAADAQAGREPAAARAGDETILLAEDDEAIRALSRRVLTESGYQVISAVDGEAALQAFRENRERIQLIVTDVIMPRKSGRDLYEEARKLAPGIKVIFTSGYPSDLVRKEGVLSGDFHFISKPSPPQTLLRKVREVLDQPAAG